LADDSETNRAFSYFPFHLQPELDEAADSFGMTWSVGSPGAASLHAGRFFSLAIN
jgi:hypothetical protein